MLLSLCGTLHWELQSLWVWEVYVFISLPDSQTTVMLIPWVQNWGIGLSLAFRYVPYLAPNIMKSKIWNEKKNQRIIFLVSRHKKADVMPQAPVQLKALNLWDTVVASQRPTGQFLWYCVAYLSLNYHWLTSITSVTQFSILWEKKGNPGEGVSPSISVCLWVICSYLPFSPSLPPFFLLYLLAL